MTIAYVTVTICTVVLNAWATIADLVRAGYVLANGERLGIPESWLPALAVPKAAGVVGLLLGLAGVPIIDAVAAAGLALFFVAAVIAHVRVGYYRGIAIPATFLASAVATLVSIVLTEPGW